MAMEVKTRPEELLRKCRRYAELLHPALASLSDSSLTAIFLRPTQRRRPHIVKSNHKRKFEWKRLYECDHAGSPRNRRDENLSPKKRRKTGPSIKVGCNAKIEVYQLVGNNVVTVDHYWQHNNHDLATLVNMKMLRNPDAVWHWLDARVHEGFDSKAIKAMIRMTSEELAEITKEVDSLPYSIKISPQDIYQVQVVSAELAMVDSFTKDDIDYEVKISDNSFVACSCLAFSRSGLVCKHMFLAQRVTTYNIQLEKLSLPAAVVSDPETIVNEGCRDEKLHLLDKALTLMDLLADRSLFKQVQSSEDELDKVSSASLTQYISAAEGLLHMKNDVFLHKLDHAKQTR
ncbi:hypothetical protein M422DRAFT_263781 [Sphaerobolus stellatus SS14]|uniref:SWIM-type domain-containing protein n=1 Tax=Sphaerobolus stellatus (strain SS14) TaxID=990650 RepID=A0A0C9V9Y6_SPHS4|nr:hypothetical protein M422DRAFT_263781 [Sphaerobolus stellatus SS14]